MKTVFTPSVAAVIGVFLFVNAVSAADVSPSGLKDGTDSDTILCSGLSVIVK